MNTPSSLTLTQHDQTLYCYLGLPESSPRLKLACFDMDSTLIHVKSGAKFATSNVDWRWFNDQVPKKLKELIDDNYLIILFSNQKGIKSGKTSPSTLQSKLDLMTQDFRQKTGHLPQQLFHAVFLAGDDDYYRKPRTGMWDFFKSHLDPNTVVDRENSFYCGDAAGRAKSWRPKAPKDFSDSDRSFAHNINLPFKVPEELFEAQTEKEALQFSTTPYQDLYQDDPILKDLQKLVFPSDQPRKELEEFSKKHDFANNQTKKPQPKFILMVGPPASGKSTLAKHLSQEHNFVYINQDTLKTKAKCLKATREAVKNNQSIIIDNTNPSPESRKEFLSLSNDNYQNLAIVLQLPKLLAFHMNNYRTQTTKGETRRIPQVAYNMFYKKYQDPQKEESIEETLFLSPHYSFPDPNLKAQFFYKYNLADR